MFSFNDYARCEAINNLPLTGDMQQSTLMSQILSLLPACHKPCFFLCGAFLKCLPADIRAHLVHNKTSDPLSLTLGTDKIFQSRVYSSSALNHVSSATILGEDCPILTVRSAPNPPAQRSLTPGPRHHHPSASSSDNCPSNSPSFCWYHCTHGEQAQKCRAP